MPDIVSCSACGAANPSGSQWCGQCYVQFVAASFPPIKENPPRSHPVRSQMGPVGPAAPPGGPKGLLGPPVPPARHERPPGSPVPSPDLPAGSVTDGWTCKACETANPVAADICRSCQTSIYETFGAGEEDRLQIEPIRAALWGALPGGGHFKVGQPALGLAVAGLLLSSLVFGVFMIGGSRRAVGVVLLAFTFIAWGISIYDVTRFATGNEGAVLMRPRVVTSAMGLVFTLVIVAAVSITGEGTTP